MSDFKKVYFQYFIIQYRITDSIIEKNAQQVQK